MYGGLRPHFLDTCRPDALDTCQPGLVFGATIMQLITMWRPLMPYLSLSLVFQAVYQRFRVYEHRSQLVLHVRQPKILSIWPCLAEHVRGGICGLVSAHARPEHPFARAGAIPAAEFAGLGTLLFRVPDHGLQTPLVGRAVRSDNRNDLCCSDRKN